MAELGFEPRNSLLPQSMVFLLQYPGGKEITETYEEEEEEILRRQNLNV